MVLAANSDYFYAMFTDGMREANQEVIELKDESISPDILTIILTPSTPESLTSTKITCLKFLLQQIIFK